MERILNITKAMSDENRLCARGILQNGELCVCRIIEMLQVSKHMSILKQAGLVEARRDGKWTYYRMVSRHSSSPECQIVSCLLRQLKDD
jgi:DNA-binding transcriptional ArsR family regulator